ncbi:MAG: 3-hydroxyacyl-CoA dehydrogenase family protein [Ferrimicrobium sp.]
MRIGVIGAGTMGIGIAHAFLTTDSTVHIADPQVEQLDLARVRIAGLMDAGVERGRLSKERAESAKHAVQYVNSLQELPKELDWIIEAVPEDPVLKARVLAEAESLSPVALATNTSALSITALGKSLGRPQSFIGLHFFNPVWSMKLVEIVVGEQSSPGMTEAARELVLGLGKTSIVVRDAPGFASSRLGILLGMEAIRMLEEGIASAEDIDTAMMVGYGHPMGPLRLTDLVGLDVRLDIATSLVAMYGERFAPPKLLVDKVAEGNLGKKSGKGFYDW